MTPAEKMAQRLEAETIVCSGVMVRRIPTQDDLDTSALIRRLAAALADCPEGNDVCGVYAEWRERHVGAFRDAREQA